MIDEIADEQRKAAEMSSATEAAIRNAEITLSELRVRTVELVGEEALQPGFVENFIARQSSDVQSGHAKMLAELSEELERDLPKLQMQSRVKIKPTRQMV